MQEIIRGRMMRRIAHNPSFGVDFDYISFLIKRTYQPRVGSTGGSGRR